MKYDKNLVEKFRALAVADAKDLVIGETYWMNDIGMLKSVVITELLTEREHNFRRGFACEAERNGEKYTWFVDENGRTYSCRDRNIGVSYNPWMIFNNESIARAACEMITVDFARNDRDLWYDYGGILL